MIKGEEISTISYKYGEVYFWQVARPFIYLNYYYFRTFIFPQCLAHFWDHFFFFTYFKYIFLVLDDKIWTYYQDVWKIILWFWQWMYWPTTKSLKTCPCYTSFAFCRVSGSACYNFIRFYNIFAQRRWNSGSPKNIVDYSTRKWRVYLLRGLFDFQNGPFWSLGSAGSIDNILIDVHENLGKQDVEFRITKNSWIIVHENRQNGV